MQKRRAERHVRKNKVYKIAIAGVAFAAMCGFLGYVFAIKSITDKWDNKIYSGVIVNGIKLEGMTEEQAEETLNKSYGSSLSNKKINFVVNGSTYNYTYGNIDGNYNIEETVDKALNFGKDKNIFKKCSLIKNKDNETYTIDLEFDYNEEKLNNIKDEVYNLSLIQAQNADLKITSAEIKLTPDVTGYELNREDLDNKVNNFIENNAGRDAEIDVDGTEIRAQRTTEELVKVTGKMSTYSTTYAVGDRGKNLELAASLINGTILMPGDTFSYDEVTQKGKGRYTFAGGYVNGKVEQVEAGGICQVCTALYRAVMRANIRSVERHNHMMTVGYALPGLDATVAWGYLDYKFTNTYDFPIYIEGIGGNGNVTFNIYGDPAGLNGNTYELVAENLGTDSQGNTKAKSYQITYKNGSEINREYIATDTYKPSVSH